MEIASFATGVTTRAPCQKSSGMSRSSAGAVRAISEDNCRCRTAKADDNSRPLRGCLLAPFPPHLQLSVVNYTPTGVSPDAALRQVKRYRAMTAAEKLACADALWDLAWDTTLAGARMRNPGAEEASTIRDAREILRRATN